MKNRSWGMSLANVFAIVLLASALNAQTPVWKGKIFKDGDVTIVQNPKEPIYREPVITLKEDLVLGGGKAQGEYAFSRARSIAVDNDGRIYVGDSQQTCVKVYNKTGGYLRTIGRRGQGPGEMSWVDSVAISHDNRELIVGDISRLIVFDLQGRFQRNIPTRGLNVATRIDGQGNVFVWISDIRGKRSILRVFGPDMTKILADIAVIPDPPEPSIYMPRAHWILDSQDRLIFGYPKTYEISIYDKHLRIEKMIRRQYVPVKVTDEDKKTYLKRSNPPGVSGPPKYPCPSVHAAFRSFFIDDLGHLFVQTWERSADDKKDFYDIYDPEGRFFGRIALNVHPDFINPTTRILRDNKLYATEVDEEGYEIVKRYSVVWKIGS
jgi:6-bladed beta-propeller